MRVSLFTYRLTFDMRITCIKPLAAIEGMASGELEGTGRWLFNCFTPPSGSGTSIGATPDH